MTQRTEREAVVAWLEMKANKHTRHVDETHISILKAGQATAAAVLRNAADSIARGEHMKGQPVEG